MLELKNLTKQYTEKNKATVTALSDVDLKFPKSGLIFILGKSGSGKSTLLNLIGGLDSPTKGEVIIDGRSTADFREADYDSYRNTYCGFVFQEYNLISNYTVGQNVALALELQREKCDRDKIDEILRRVELIDGDGKTLADRSVNQLSGGQKQRVAIARALIKEPKVILADEPTGALDCDTAQNFYGLLKELSKEKLIIVVTHDRVNAESYGDRVIELSDGRVVSDTVTSDAEGPMTDGEESLKAQTTAVRKGLPLKRKLSMGLAGLKVKPFRLVLSIILSLVAVVAFGFCMTTTVIDEYTTELLAAEQEGQRVAVLYNYLETEDGTELSPFSEEQEEIIKEFTQGKQVNVLTDLWRYEIPRFMRSYLGEGNYYNLNPYREIALCEIVMGVELDPATGEEDACLKPDDRFLDPNNCRLPSSDHEIAITDIRASMFMLFGYKAEDGETAEIKTPDDLIGKNLETTAYVAFFPQNRAENITNHMIMIITIWICIRRLL